MLYIYRPPNLKDCNLGNEFLKKELRIKGWFFDSKQFFLLDGVPEPIRKTKLKGWKIRRNFHSKLKEAITARLSQATFSARINSINCPLGFVVCIWTVTFGFCAHCSKNSNFCLFQVRFVLFSSSYCHLCPEFLWDKTKMDSEFQSVGTKIQMWLLRQCALYSLRPSETLDQKLIKMKVFDMESHRVSKNAKCPRHF